MHEASIAPKSVAGFRDVLEPADYQRLEGIMDRFRRTVDGRTLWNVNSTEQGGGVAELLSTLLPYARGAGADVRWLVIDGDDEFFKVTKQLHHLLHESSGDGGPLGDDQRLIYERTLARDGAAMCEAMRPGDFAVLHDPQTVGMVPALAQRGVHVVWRCHIGVDTPGPLARSAWDFLEPDLQAADASIFSRSEYVWDGLAAERVTIMTPCIDALSPKNQSLSTTQTTAILRQSRIVDGAKAQPNEAKFLRVDGRRGRVRRQVEAFEESMLPNDARLVVQVSRWDPLKDPCGAISLFADCVVPATDNVHLLLAGPATGAVADDPESTATFNDVCGHWNNLPSDARRRVHIAKLPMEDSDENSAIVNAIQRRADVVLQKSLAEGFGLTVAEAMWKKRPVVASRVGGIQDQVVDGQDGRLIDDPHDYAAFATAINELLQDKPQATAMGKAAHRRVCDRFLPLNHFATEANVLSEIAS